MNSQFLSCFIFYVGVICVGVYFAGFYDYDPYDQITHTIIGILMGCASTLLALVIVMKISKKEKMGVKA